MNDLKEDDLVLCTVRKIENTSVFLDIEGNGQGSMVFSEVSPGRIRNIRDFIVPNKKIVCKVLKIRDGHPELSLRRVTAKEREFILDRFKKEKSFEAMLKPILKEKTIQTIEKIKEEHDIAEFLALAKEKPEIIERFVPEPQAETLKKIFASKLVSDKEKHVKKIIKIKTLSETGIKDIKSLLDIKDNNVEIRYLGSSTFSISVKDTDFKKANSKIDNLISMLKEKAKSTGIQFEAK